jgi:hypothetical protein
MKLKLSLFATGFIQVWFVAVNTYFLSKEFYIGVFFAAFMISLIWSFNVKKIAFGNKYDRIIYAIGASLGSLSGLQFSIYIKELI